MLRGWRLSWLCVWAAGLVTSVIAAVGRYGINPTDQGYVLAQTWQIRRGAVPHLEAISSRPFGSEILHQLDFWLPGPLYLSSMWLSTLELVLATVWLAVLVLDRPVRVWGPGLYALVTTAVLINVHTFPLMAWPTIDGLALVAGGLLAVSRGLRRDSAVLCAVGALACGFAPLTKQSFAAAPIVALVLLRSRQHRRAWAWVLLPGLGYVTWVTVGGGLRAMTDQLLGGHAVYGRELVTGAATLLWHRPVLALLCAGTLAALTALAATRTVRARRIGGIAFLVLLGATVVDSRLVVGGSWGDLILWATAGIVLVRVVQERHRPDTALLLLLVVAWMVSLSWGYANPDLVSGSLLLTSAVEVWRLLGEPALSSKVALPLALMGVLGAGTLVYTARDNVYYEGPRSTLTRDAGAFAPGLRGVRTTPRTLSYLQEIRACIEAHPARRVAVLPDNPFIYPLLGLDDPFPQIWVLPQEVYGDVPRQLVDAARRLGGQGDYLVLFQTYSAFDIDTAGPVVSPADLFVPGLQRAIAAELPGDDVRCGSLVGIYRPKPP